MDFVTVCFSDDLPQMQVQAASMERYLRKFPVDNIIVVINDEDYAACERYFRERVMPMYGFLQDFVKLVNGDTLVNPMYRYYNQMLLKLVTAKLVSAEHYCILDAKNFLAAHWTEADVFDSERRLKAKYLPLMDQWDQGCKRSFELFGLDYTQYPKVSQHTPFFAHSEIVQSMINRPDFEDTFKKQMLVEFPLIQAATIACYGDFESAYWITDDDHNDKAKFKTRYNPGIWQIDCEHINRNNNLEWYLLWTEAKILAAGVHRSCFLHLSEHNIAALKHIWMKLKIVDQRQADVIVSEMQDRNREKILSG